MSERIQVRPQGQVGVDSFSSGHDVQIAPFREHQVATPKVFEVGSKPAVWPSNSLCDEPELAARRREDRQDAVGFAVIGSAQHDSVGPVQAILKR
jgi:hypothetical protein